MMTDAERDQYHADLEAMMARLREMGRAIREDHVPMPAVDASLGKAHDALRDAIDHLAWAKG